MPKYVALIVLALALAGCGSNQWEKEGCTSIGSQDLCATKVNGEECTIIRERTFFASDRTTSECKNNGTITCNNEYGNESGNVCRVKVDGYECVAVLPDGGKAPKYDQKYVTCPKAEAK